MTIGELQRKLTARLEEMGEPYAADEAKEVLCFLLDLPKNTLLQKRGEELPAEQLAALEERLEGCLGERKLGRPWAYIFGGCWFFGEHFEVEEGVLIPRADTEVLVEEALAELRLRVLAEEARLEELWPAAWEGAEGEASDFFDTRSQREEESKLWPIRVTELCVGSGCVLLSLTKHMADFQKERDSQTHVHIRYLGSDIEARTVALAQKNAERLVPGEDITWKQADLLEAFTGEPSQDLVIVNPPYVTREEYDALEPQVKEFEPRVALTDEGDGLEFYRLLFEQRPLWLKKNGLLLLEHGYTQREAIRELGTEAGWTLVKERDDYAGQPRVSIWAPPRG